MKVKEEDEEHGVAMVNSIGGFTGFYCPHIIFEPDLSITSKRVTLTFQLLQKRPLWFLSELVSTQLVFSSF